MARETIVNVLDDLDGSTGASTRSFAIDGTLYEIDLTDDNWESLIGALDPYIDAATEVRPNGAAARVKRHPLNGRQVERVAKAPNRPAATPASYTRTVLDPGSKVIRPWWTSNYRKLNLPEPKGRGRIPEAVMEAYREANA